MTLAGPGLLLDQLDAAVFFASGFGIVRRHALGAQPFRIDLVAGRQRLDNAPTVRLAA
jgi:hypothetical protein